MFLKKKEKTTISVDDLMNHIDVGVSEQNMWEVESGQLDISAEGESFSESNKGFTINDEDFGNLIVYVKDETITDIDFNGTDLWLTDINNKHWKNETIEVTPKFIRKLAQNIANSQSKEFNQMNCVIEAETPELRISIIHNSIAQTGTTMCIRKTPRKERIKAYEAIQNGYASQEMLALLVNCIKAHMNIVVCGEPRAGKTEFAKFISGYIPVGERVITIEDVMEWRYKDLHPDADVIEMKVNNNFTYSDAIIASLKQNPKWIMIAESRGEEVKNLIQSFSTGVNGITTLHTDDVRKIPSRIVNMANDSLTEGRIYDNVYEFIDVGLFISMKPDKNGDIKRYIDQIAFFGKGDDGEEEICLMANYGKLRKDVEIPSKILKKFKHAGVFDIYQNDALNKSIELQAIRSVSQE